MSEKYLNGKVAVVTGASGVLCSAMALRLAHMGAKVAVIGRSVEKIDAAVKEIGAVSETIGISCDVTDVEDVRRAAAEVNSKLGTCDILINGAGGNAPAGITTDSFYNIGDQDKSSPDFRTFFDLDMKGFGNVFDVNFMGTVIPSQVFGADMVEKGSSSTIINVSSMSAYTSLTKVAAYCAAKAAVSNFTEWLSVHFALTNVRVNAIAPGFFITKQNERLLTNEDGTFTERGQKVINKTPMRRFGKPEELLGVLEWLVDDRKSSFVTGVVIPVDGGFLAYAGV